MVGWKKNVGRDSMHRLSAPYGNGIKFQVFCDKCHTDLYPYTELPEHIKEYDRVTVRRVLQALGELAAPEEAKD